VVTRSYIVKTEDMIGIDFPGSRPRYKCCGQVDPFTIVRKSSEAGLCLIIATHKASAKGGRGVVASWRGAHLAARHHNVCRSSFADMRRFLSRWLI